MRDALSGRSGDGAPESPPPPPGPSPTTAPADSAAARPSTHPEATRAGRHGRPSRPTALNNPVHHTREDAPGRLRNNPPDEEDQPEQTATTTLTPHAFKTTPEQSIFPVPARARRGAARGDAPGSTADGGDGAVHRARATGVRGPPPRPSLES